MSTTEKGLLAILAGTLSRVGLWKSPPDSVIVVKDQID